MMNRTSQLSRRGALKVLAAAALGSVLVARVVPPVEAGRSWCRVDPVVEIDGGVADVFLSSYLDLHLAATGPAEIVISVPVGTSTKVLLVDPGFGGHGYDFKFKESNGLKFAEKRPQLIVEAYVPSSDGSLPLRVDFMPVTSKLHSASAEGSVNDWVRAKSR